MTTIVKHRRTGKQYILLGINGEINKVNPSRLISELFNQEKSEVSCSATLCDVEGNIFLAYIDDLVVTEIDGIKPSDILPETSYQDQAVEQDFDQSPSPEWKDEEFTSETVPSSESENIAVPPQADVVESLDAPHQDLDDDDEDWI